MMSLCVKLSPDQPSYEDTYAWIFYQLKDYNNALLWIEQAISNGGKSSATIVEHYGDILYRLSKTDAALLQWQKAKELGWGEKPQWQIHQEKEAAEALASIPSLEDL